MKQNYDMLWFIFAMVLVLSAIAALGLGLIGDWPTVIFSMAMVVVVALCLAAALIVYEVFG